MRIAFLTAYLVIATFARSARADDKAEVLFQADDSDADWVGIDVFASRPVPANQRVEVTAFALVTGDWSEGYVGPTYAFTPWLTLGAAAGFEQHNGDLGWRFALSFYNSYRKFSALGIVEFNPDALAGDSSGAWFDLTPMYEIEPWLKVGAKWRRGVGAGPLVELSTLTHPSGSLWVAWMPVEPFAGSHQTRFAGGLQVRF